MAAADIQEQYATAPGNWLAQEIRRFQEQSTGLFPSPKPGDERTRYNTIYGIDYAPLANVRITFFRDSDFECHVCMRFGRVTSSVYV